MEDEFLRDLSSTQSTKKTLLMMSILCALGMISCGLYLLFTSPRSTVRLAPATLPPFAPTQTIFVDVEGAVEQPGIVKIVLPIDGSVRIADVIASSGGLRADADTEYVAKTINQALPAKDGTKIYIPQKGDSTKDAPASGTKSSLVNINTASVSELERLHGIGAGRAGEIEQNRPYQTIEELQRKVKLPQSVVDAIRNEITF